jgi:tRNA modification GTPase
MLFSCRDTIAAIATPHGKGAVSLIRVSGDRSNEIARTVFQPRSDKGLRFYYPQVGEFLSPQKRFIDQVVLIVYQKPKSYTGEDMLEISCHGSPVVTAEILETLTSLGVRLAEPGEFSFRAFIHGKMDLVQAESIQQLIDAQTKRQAMFAVEDLRGRVSKRLAGIKDRLIQIIVDLETAVEFVEDALEEVRFEKAGSLIEEIGAEMSRLSRSYESGSIIQQGRKMVILGRANVGKSSIFNKLINEERAIVFEIPGTTRDTLHGVMELNGVPIQILDTAGWRKTRNKVEQEGLRRSEQALDEADMVLLVLDAGTGWVAADKRILERAQGKKLLPVWNKMDLLETKKKPKVKALQGWNVCYVSAKTGMGIEECKSKISALLFPEDFEEDEPIITNLRHKQQVDQSVGYLLQAMEATRKKYSEEYVLTDLKKALECLDRITGETTEEDILGKIFSRFCIGK